MDTESVSERIVMQLVGLLVAPDSMSTYPRPDVGYHSNASHANPCLEPKRRKMLPIIVLQACAKLVDQKIDRVHIVRIKRLRWLVFVRYVCHCVVKCRLEVSDRRRERCNGLLLDCCPSRGLDRDTDVGEAYGCGGGCG